MRTLFFFSFALLTLLSCNQTKEQTVNVEIVETPKHNNWIPPEPGVIIAEYKEQVLSDKLNDTYFLVQILSTDISKDGLFDLVLGYGQNINTTTLELPQWENGIVLKPAIEKGEKELQCYIGFVAEDTLFHEFYKVSAEDKDIRLKQTKSYNLSR